MRAHDMGKEIDEAVRKAISRGISVAYCEDPDEDARAAGPVQVQTGGQGCSQVQKCGGGWERTVTCALYDLTVCTGLAWSAARCLGAALRPRHVILLVFLELYLDLLVQGARKVWACTWRTGGDER